MGNLPSNIDDGKSYLVAGSTLRELVRIAASVKRMVGRDGVKVSIADDNIVISLVGYDETGPTEDVTVGGGGAGLPEGYTFEEFTICDSGTPATRWWPTWTADPEAEAE